MSARDKHSSVAAKSKRAVKPKVKQVPVHAESLENISAALSWSSTDIITPTLQPAALLALISNIFDKEARRVRGIE